MFYSVSYWIGSCLSEVIPVAIPSITVGLMMDVASQLKQGGLLSLVGRAFATSHVQLEHMADDLPGNTSSDVAEHSLDCNGPELLH